jgi:hypothetical protein
MAKKRRKARTSPKPRASRKKKDAQNEREESSANSSAGPEPTEEALRDRLAKAEAVAGDERAPDGERNAAEAAAAGLREQIRALAERGDPKYRDLVERGKAAAKNLWTLGDLARQVQTEYGGESLARYADHIGVPYEVLKACRTTAAAWPDEKGRRLPFSVCRAMNILPDRFKIAEKRPGLNVAQARELATMYRDSQRRDESEERPGRGRRRSMTERSARNLTARLVDLVGPLTDLADEDLTDLDPDVRDELRDAIVAVRAGLGRLLDELESISNDDATDSTDSTADEEETVH